MAVTLGMYAPNEGPKRWGFAEQAKKLRLASALGDGTINITPAWFVVVDETVYVPLDPDVGDPIHSSTPDATHIQIIQGGGRVSAIIDEGDELNNVRAVQIGGRGEIVEDEDLIELLNDLAAEKYFYVGHPHLEHYFSAGMVSSRRWCRLVEEEIDAWDMRVLLQPPVQDHLPFPEHMLADE
jgi:hypothetical protein